MATTEISWDGIDYSYVPPRELRVHESLRRHTEADDRVDPITHEVLRHALWNVNTEHGNTIMKISGSPICAYGHDFNPSILDENGDFVFQKKSIDSPVAASTPTRWPKRWGPSSAWSSAGLPPGAFWAKAASSSFATAGSGAAGGGIWGGATDDVRGGEN